MKQDILREIQILTEINHTNVVKIHDACVTKSSYNLLMEYCNGGNLENYLKARGGHIVEEEARLILKQIVEGLQAIK